MKREVRVAKIPRARVERVQSSVRQKLNDHLVHRAHVRVLLREVDARLPAGRVRAAGLVAAAPARSARRTSGSGSASSGVQAARVVRPNEPAMIRTVEELRPDSSAPRAPSPPNRARAASHRRGALRGPLAAVVVVVVVVAARARRRRRAAAPPAARLLRRRERRLRLPQHLLHAVRLLLHPGRQRVECADSTDGAAAIAGLPARGYRPRAASAPTRRPPGSRRSGRRRRARLRERRRGDVDGRRAREIGVPLFAAATSSGVSPDVDVSRRDGEFERARNPRSAPRGPRRRATPRGRAGDRAPVRAAARGPRTDANANARGPAATSRPPSNATTRLRPRSPRLGERRRGDFRRRIFSQRAPSPPTRRTLARRAGRSPAGGTEPPRPAPRAGLGDAVEDDGRADADRGLGARAGRALDASTAAASPTKRRPLCA